MKGFKRNWATARAVGVGMPVNSKHSLVARTLRMAMVRIGLVSICAGAVSYQINRASIEDSTRQQLILSTEQTLQRESLPFREIKDLQRNFLEDFRRVYAEPANRKKLARDFELIFYRHEDGSYTQRPNLFEGKALPDGRRFARMSATYAPEIKPDADIKARFTLSYLLSHQYGSNTRGRLFNFYGVVPEKGFPIYQNADISKVFSYSGPQALKLETYEFYSRGFGSPGNETIFTRIYWDYSNASWMTTIATPDQADVSGKHRILACVDVLLDKLMQRMTTPSLHGAYNTIIQADSGGTLIFHPLYTEAIKQSAGSASIKSLKLLGDYPILDAVPRLASGKALLIETRDDIVAAGIIPESPWVLAVHYPKTLMRPAIIQNFLVVMALGLFTLLVEIFVIRSILQNQVALPLGQLIRAMQLVGQARTRVDVPELPVQARDEVGELARNFARMAQRVEESQHELEVKVQERTEALQEANDQLLALSTTDTLTGIANRRRFDTVLDEEWRRAIRVCSPLAVAMIDVDWFKQYNDQYGHQAGDDCLRQVAHLLCAHANRAGDLIARYGGEEFALIITTFRPEDLQPYIKTICDEFVRTHLPYAKSLFGCVTVSIGAAMIVPMEGQRPEIVLKLADDALYRAKRAGRNQVCVVEDPALQGFIKNN